MQNSRIKAAKTRRNRNAGCYATFVVVCPGCVIEITPPQLHMHFEVEFSAGLPPIVTVGEPGVQGLAITGTHA